MIYDDPQAKMPATCLIQPFAVLIGYLGKRGQLISTVAGVRLLVQSLAEQDDGATWTLFPAHRPPYPCEASTNREGRALSRGAD
jgi:hypothetical protein